MSRGDLDLPGVLPKSAPRSNPKHQALNLKRGRFNELNSSTFTELLIDYLSVG